jgi:hypothetical protein
VPAALATTFKQPFGVSDARALTELDGDVLLVDKNAAKLNARAEHDAAVLHLFRERYDHRFDEGTNRLDDGERLFPQHSKIFQQCLNRPRHVCSDPSSRGDL